MPILGNGRGQKRGLPQELGIKLFFMMLGGHIQCISEEISFIELCLTFSAIIYIYWLDYIDGSRSSNIDLSHWYKVDKVFYTPEAKLRCVKITSYITKRS